MANLRYARLIAFSIVALTMFGLVLEGQTAKKKSGARPSKSKTSLVRIKAIEDSLKAAHADSLGRAMLAQSIADSLLRKHAADSLEQWRADSVGKFQLRKIPNTAFGVGERLVFDVNYGFINAGEAVMQVASYDTIDGRKCYRVEFSVNSHPSFNWVYRVEDRYLTFIDVDAIVPWKFEQHIREGSYRRDFIAEFDQVHHVAKTSEGPHPIPDYVHDIMSAFYFARTLDYTNMKVGEGPTLFNFYKDTSHVLKVRFLGRQELEVEAGTFNTLVVEPLVQEGGLFKTEGRIVIWLTDDDRKIPVRVNTKVVIGSIDTELKEYSGLIGPLRARIK